MSIRTVGIGVLAALCAFVAAGRADALEIVFDGPGGFGISALRAAAAEADGLQIVDVDQLATAAGLGLTIPAPNVQSFELVSSPSLSNPNRATSQWNVTNGGQGDLTDAWLVFLNPMTYTRSQVGFEIDDEDGWAVFSVFAAGSEYFYPARFLGGMDSAEVVAFTMQHLVGQPLTQNSAGEFVLPRYSVGALSGVPLPEPAALALSGLSLALLAVLRRRSA